MPRVAKPKQTYPPDWATYRWPSLTVLSFDQSLAHTGWAVIDTAPFRPPVVRVYGSIVTEPKLTGWYDSMARGIELMDAIGDVLNNNAVTGLNRIDAVVHEMPVMMGGTVSRKQEGPPISALAVQAAVRHYDRDLPVVMMEIQRWKRWITGNHRAEKSEIREALWKIIPIFRTNEHVVDAVGIGLGAICEGKIQPLKMLDSELDNGVGSEA